MSVTFFILIFNSLEMLYLTETILQKLHDFLKCCCKPRFICLGFLGFLKQKKDVLAGCFPEP